MLPRTETLEQLKTAVDGLCFHPVGRKGNGGWRSFCGRDGRNVQSFPLSDAADRIAQGIENLPAMLETYGERISAIVIGPYDMAVMVGTPGDIYSDAMDASVRRVFEICSSYQKSCGIFCNHAADAERFRAMAQTSSGRESTRSWSARAFAARLPILKKSNRTDNGKTDYGKNRSA
jgi:2-keto-3-deoxy-L-rhamnonate aldolase RhmA